MQHDIELIRLRHCDDRAHRCYPACVDEPRADAVSQTTCHHLSRFECCASMHSTQKLCCGARKSCAVGLDTLNVPCECSLLAKPSVSAYESATCSRHLANSTIRLQYLMTHMLNHNCSRIRWNKEEQAKAVSTKSLQHLPAQ